MKQYKRKQYVVNKKLQYGIISRFLVSVLIAIVIFSAGVVLYYWISSSVGDNLFKEFIVIHKQIETEKVVTNEAGEEVTETVYSSEVLPPVKRINIVLPPILINNLLILVLIVIFGIFSSHKIAGPAYRMIADIQQVLDGNTSVRVQLRQKDSLKDLAERVNDLIEAFEKAQKSG